MSDTSNENADDDEGQYLKDVEHSRQQDAIHDSLRKKVRGLFASHFPDASNERPLTLLIAPAIAGEYPDAERARDIAFHLADWIGEAEFLVALRLAPEAFTPEEIATGVQACLIHIPNHIAAAAALAGWPMKDIFRVGAVIEAADAP